MMRKIVSLFVACLVAVLNGCTAADTIAAGISERLLHVWPVFLNKHGRIVYIPRYKKGFSEYHSSSMIIHVNEDEK